MAFQYFLDGFRNFAQFTGRARRSEYWYFYLFAVLILFGLSFLSGLILKESGIYLVVVYYLACLIPFLSLGVRRMHDAGKSGWFLLIPIYSLILLFTDSEPGENKWGPNPKGIGNTENSDDLIQNIGQQ
jgi:uncharacterized membrane protein YhaH (DUF805 family)